MKEQFSLKGNPNDAINNEKIKNFYLGSNFSI